MLFDHDDVTCVADQRLHRSGTEVWERPVVQGGEDHDGPGSVAF
jgi:hypothetical protein